MKTLVVYDNLGTILYQSQGTYYKPIGVPYLELEIPIEKILRGINTDVIPNIPIYQDKPMTESENLQQQLLQTQKIIVEMKYQELLNKTTN